MLFRNSRYQATNAAELYKEMMNKHYIPHDQKFYKYMSLDTALICLKNGTLKFSAPSELNDCLEAVYGEVSPEAHIKTVLEELNRIARARGSPTCICPSPISEELRAAIMNENARFRQHMDSIGIFSSTCRPDNQAMWAYYAQNSTGLCFELDFDDTVVREFGLRARRVEYVSAPRTVNRADFYGSVLRSYAEPHPELSVEELKEISLGETFLREWGQETSMYAASIKHPDWEREGELRVYAGKAEIKPMLARTLKRVFFNKMSGPGFAEAIYIAEKMYGAEIVQISFAPTGGSLSPAHFKLIP